MVCDVSRAFFYAPVQHEIYGELCEEAKKIVEDNMVCKATHEHVWDQGRRSKIGKESPTNDGHTRFLNWEGFARSVLSFPKKFEMSCARKRFRCVRRTVLMRKRVGVEARNQHYNTWGRTRNVEGGEDIE